MRVSFIQWSLHLYLTLNIDIVLDGPFYDLGRLQRLRECTVDLKVRAGENPVPYFCQLLHALPPLSEHGLRHLQLSFDLTSIHLDENNIAGSHVLFSISTWRNFDAALVNVVSSGTRPFQLELKFFFSHETSRPIHC